MCRVHHEKRWAGGSRFPLAGIKISRKNINNLRYADDTALMAESEGELKSLLMKLKEQSEKAVLKLNIQKTKIMAPSPITSRQIDGETIECLPDPGIEPKSPALQADSSLSEPPRKHCPLQPRSLGIYKSPPILQLLSETHFFAKKKKKSHLFKLKMHFSHWILSSYDYVYLRKLSIVRLKIPGE